MSVFCKGLGGSSENSDDLGAAGGGTAQTSEEKLFGSKAHPPRHRRLPTLSGQYSQSQEHQQEELERSIRRSPD